MVVDLLCSPERRTHRRTALFEDLLAFLKEAVPAALESAEVSGADFQIQHDVVD